MQITLGQKITIISLPFFNNPYRTYSKLGVMGFFLYIIGVIIQIMVEY